MQIFFRFFIGLREELLKLTMAKIAVLFVLFILINSVAAAGIVQGHCCQNDLCPIDCVQCDGEPTCYDLSDELGCSNSSDKKLLSYKKPPIFVPIILAVLKAQLRREKVEFGYRFPDRNCLAPATSTLGNGNQPLYDVIDVTTQPTTTTTTTTEEPVWLQLLRKLKARLDTTPTTTTTTTTEMPLWKLLFHKLTADQNTNNSPVTSWSKVAETTTSAYQASQTPPLRRTAPPPITPRISNLTTASIRDQTTSLTTQPTSTVIKEQATTSKQKNENATEITQQTSTKLTEQSTTDTMEQITSEKLQIYTKEIKVQSTEHTTVKYLQRSTAQLLPTGAPVTFKETVFFTTPKQEFITHNKQQEVVTQNKQQQIANQNTQQEIVTQNKQQEVVTQNKQQEIVTQNKQQLVNQSKQQKIFTQGHSQNATDTPSTNVYSRNSSEQTVLTDLAINVSSIQSTTYLQKMRTNTDIITPRSEYSNGKPKVNITTLDNVGISKFNHSINKTLKSKETLTVKDVSTVSHFASKGSLTEALIVSVEKTDQSNHTKGHKQGFRNVNGSNNLTTQISNTKPKKAASHMQITDVTAEKESFQHRISDTLSVTTDHPLYLLSDLGVKISTEFPKTVTEAETPAPLPESITPQQLLETIITEIKTKVNETLLSWHNSSGNNDSKIWIETGFSYPSTDSSIKEHNNGHMHVNTSSFTNGATEKYSENGKSSSLNHSLSNHSESNFNLDRLVVNKLLEILLANYPKSNISLLSGNLTSSDFIYPSLETKNAVQDNIKFNYSVGKGNIHEPMLYDSSHSKDTITNHDATHTTDKPFSVSLVERQEKMRHTLKDKVATASATNTTDKPFSVSIVESKEKMRHTIKDKVATASATNTTDKPFSVSIVESKEKMRHTIKDKVATSSVQMSPENEVRIMLGKLNALVSKTVAPSRFTSSPVLREVSHAQAAGTTMVFSIATETPALFTQRPTNAPITHLQEKTQITQPVTVLQVQRATATPVPWWQQTTLSPFSIDNLFGFTSAPPFGQDWLNPTTSAYTWDAMFGSGGVPVSRETTAPPYNANQDILNNIYDPLRAETQIPEAPLNQLVQHKGRFGGVVQNTNSHISAGGNSGQGISSKQSIPPADHKKPSTGPKNSLSESNKPTMKTNIPQAKPTTTQEPPLKGFDIFNTFMESLYPGNFSIGSKSNIQTTEKPSLQITTKFNSNLKRFIEKTTPVPPESIPAKSIPISPIVFRKPEVPNYIQNSENISSAEITTKRTLLPLHAIASANKHDIKIVYDVTPPKPVTQRIPVISTRLPLAPMTSLLTNFWFTRKPVKETASIPVMPVTQHIRVKPVTTPVPVRPVKNITPVPRANTASYWNPGSNRVLPTDTISSWWAQVQPTVPPPAFVTNQTPTPTPVASLDHCYQTQDPTGFCQSRYSGHYSNPSDCRSFYVCIWGLLYSCACPPNTMFDDKVDVCNWDQFVTCTKKV